MIFDHFIDTLYRRAADFQVSLYTAWSPLRCVRTFVQDKVQAQQEG
jgi:hypothetical protein